MTNGLAGYATKSKYGLIAAAESFDIPAMGTHHKTDMREIIMSGGPWSSEQQNDILEYCAHDVTITANLFQKLLSGDLTPYFFARWNQKSPFTFLGSGSIRSFEDGYKSPQGHICIRFVIAVDELDEIIAPHTPTTDNPSAVEHRSSFVFEKHLEDFL